MSINNLEFKIECSVPLSVFLDGDIDAIIDLILAAGFKMGADNKLIGEFIVVADHCTETLTYTQTYTYQQWLGAKHTIH